MTRKQKFLVWALVLTVTLMCIASAGCGSKESEDTTAPPDTVDTTPDTTPDVSQQRPEGGFIFRGSAIMSMLAGIEDEVIDTALQEALDESRITEEQAEDIRIWWTIRPEFLNPDVFPRQMPENGFIIENGLTPDDMPQEFHEGDFMPDDIPQEHAEGGFVFGRTAIMSMLAGIEDEAINTALQEALDESRITDEQALDIKIWWALRPEFLNLDFFPRQMPQR